MISVCMATYNGAKYIEEQLSSILLQLKECDELIISDDGSSDYTCDIIQKMNDPRIKLIFNKGVHGYVGNFENAMKNAKGDYIFLSDQDDIWFSNKVKVLSESLQKSMLVVHDALLVDGNGNSLGKTYFSVMHQKCGFWANLFRPRYLGCCMAFRKEILDFVMPFPSYRRGHDYWIGCITSSKYPIEFLADVLIAYRRHEKNASTSSGKSEKGLYDRLEKRFNMLVLVVGRLLHIA